LSLIRILLIVIVLAAGLAACSASGMTAGTAGSTAVTAAAAEAAISAIPLTVTASPTFSATLSTVSPAKLAETPALTASPSSTGSVPKTPAGSRTLAVTPTLPACLNEPGQMVKKSLATSLLRYPLEYRVYLPPCYAEQADRRYPVLFLFHGQGYTDDQWDRIGVDEQSDKLIAAGTIPALIIVMPHDVSSAQPSETNFSKVIVEQLIPAIDRTYRTKPERQYRAVGGMSRGGGWAIHFGITYPQMFGALGAHSPAVFHSDGLRIKALLDALPPSESPRIYIDIGERDRPEILQVATWFEGLLDERDIAHEWHLFSGYHAEAYWSAHLDQYLIWYTQGW
jgi:enterochelin esterase-like enzyme